MKSYYNAMGQSEISKDYLGTYVDTNRLVESITETLELSKDNCFGLERDG